MLQIFYYIYQSNSRYVPEEIQTTGFRFLDYLFLMQDDLRKYIRSFLNESLSDERDLDKLANIILKYVAEKLVKKDGHLVFKKGEEDIYEIYSPDFDIYKYTLDLNGISENIKNWVETNGLRIIFSSDAEPSYKGAYDTPKTIYLYYQRNASYLKDIWDMMNNRYIQIGSTTPIKPEATDLYIKLYYPFHSTLLHELRHAYDDYRSNRKYLKTKRWEKHKKHLDTLTPLNPESEESIKQHSEKEKSYLRLAHEINARFSQAIAKTHFDQLTDDWESKVKRPFDDVLKDFKYKFDNWRHLTPKMQQWITKRLYKYWDEHEVQPLS